MQLLRFLSLLGLVCVGASAMTVYVQPSPLESEDVLNIFPLTEGHTDHAKFQKSMRIRDAAPLRSRRRRRSSSHEIGRGQRARWRMVASFNVDNDSSIVGS